MTLKIQFLQKKIKLQVHDVTYLNSEVKTCSHTFGSDPI